MQDPKSAKKVFVPPHLVTYGDIQSITMAIMMTGAMDTGGMGAMVRTR